MSTESTSNLLSAANEIKSMADQYALLHTMVNSYIKDEEDKSKRIKELEAKISELNEQNNNLKEANEALDEQVTELEDKCNEQTKQLASLTDDVNQYAIRESRLATEIAKHTAEIKRLNAIIKLRNDDLHTVKARCSELEVNCNVNELAKEAADTRANKYKNKLKSVAPLLSSLSSFIGRQPSLDLSDDEDATPTSNTAKPTTSTNTSKQRNVVYKHIYGTQVATVETTA